MPPHEYEGIEVIQQPGAPAFYITSVPAVELLEWCDVPRAKGDYMAGYQRTLESRRIAELAEYLRLSPSNIIPGAVIVAVDEEYVQVEDASGPLRRIAITEDTRDFATKLHELWGSFTTRLTEDELASAGISYFSYEDGVKDPEANPDEASETPAAEDGTTDTDLLPDPELLAIADADVEDARDEDSDGGDADEDDEEDEGTYPSSYLASLAQELTLAVQDWESVPLERRRAIYAFIEGVSKPGLIIDGQHRVFGAKGVSEHDVRLPVVLLPGLPFAEQVFQFYVLNSKAKPLKPTELRRIVSTSLTNAEIEALYERFRTAGIDADEARWTLQMNTHPTPPSGGASTLALANRERLFQKTSRTNWCVRS